MNLLVNGKTLDVCARTIADLMAVLEIPPQGCAIAVGTQIIPMDRWDDYALNNNDTITIIKATQGG